jgi:hypothetical protein
MAKSSRKRRGRSVEQHEQEADPRNQRKKKGGCKIRAAKIMVNLRSHWAKERGRNLLRSESRGTTGEHEIQAFIAVCCLTTVMVCSEPIPILLVSGSKQRERKRPPRLLQEAMDVTMEEGLNATATTTP